MNPQTPWRLKVLAWGNLFIAVVTPIGVVFNILGALKVFSVEWSFSSIMAASLLGSILGSLTGLSGWGIMYRRTWAHSITWIAGSLTLGYVIHGMLLMTTEGLDRGLLILIRHGSQDWWDWSLSHFQDSVLREIPLLAWWVCGLGTVIRYPLPGAAPTLPWRLFNACGWLVPLGLLGAVARVFQLICDSSLYSQR